MPTLQELYGSKGTYGNPNLENEKSNSYEVRLGYKVNDKWNINLTRYQYDIEDMINGDKTAAQTGLAGRQWFRDRNGNNLILAGTDKVYTNIKEAEISGLEFGTKGKINDKFYLALSYTKFDKAEDKDTKERLTSVPDYRATMALEYHQDKTSAVLAVSHQGKTKAVGNNYAALDSSTICDFYIKQQCNKDFSVYLKVANIGDKKDVILTQNKPGNNASPYAGCYYYEEGRVVTLGMELKCD